MKDLLVWLGLTIGFMIILSIVGMLIGFIIKVIQ